MKKELLKTHFDIANVDLVLYDNETEANFQVYIKCQDSILLYESIYRVDAKIAYMKILESIFQTHSLLDESICLHIIDIPSGDYLNF